MKTTLLIVALLLLAVPCMAQTNLQFQWDAHAQASQLAGFKLYSGTVSGTYAVAPVATFIGGSLTSGTIARPTKIGKTFYVLSAYDSAGNESGYSNEVSYTVAISPPTGLKNPILVAIGKVLTKLAGLFGKHQTLRVVG